ncbi:MAG: alkaline phosphatase family protein [Planctomycetota bacterium]
MLLLPSLALHLAAVAPALPAPQEDAAAIGASLATAAPIAAPAAAPVAAPVAAPGPRLVVLLSVDQMIPEQLTRLRPAFSGGLARLLEEGTVFTAATLDYARTETGAGHTTLSTGCLPRSHGIVGNGFFDREEARFQYCVEDPGAAAVTSAGRIEGQGQRSPRNLQRPTLGELIQGQVPGSKVVSVSAKDRAAIGMGGRSDGAVLWWDKLGAGFMTSTWYAEALPGFVDRWNGSWLERAGGWDWTPALPEDVAALGTAADERPGERPFGDRGVRLPYTLGDASSPRRLAGEVFQTPLVDLFTAEMGRLAMREYGLGLDEQTDLLALSFSGCDVVGHAFGPYSHEVTDLLLRLDGELGALFDELDERVGEGRWVAALSADHGVLPLPERLAVLGEPATRVSIAESGAFNARLSEALSAELGHRVRVYRRDGGLVMDRKDLDKASVSVDAACDRLLPLAEALAAETPWVHSVHDHRAVAAMTDEARGADLLLRNTHFPGRTPDVVVLRAQGVLVPSALGTSHGSHHMYDRRVPLAFLGAGVSPATRSDRVGTEDVVPTLLSLLGLEVPEGLDGVDLGVR